MLTTVLASLFVFFLHASALNVTGAALDDETTLLQHGMLRADVVYEEKKEDVPLVSSSQRVFINSSFMYRQIVDNLEKYALPLASTSQIDHVGFTPFCSNFTKPGSLPGITPECLPWEMNELDILLMYIDLISVGMKKELAEEFYKEIRCLSRAHTVSMPGRKSWQVCFKHDYSEVVGGLLSKYVLQDPSMSASGQEVETDEDGNLLTSSRFLFGRWGAVNSRNRGSFLLHAFGSGASFRVYKNPWETKRQTSCCKRCKKWNYFVNIGRSQCMRSPFAKHCCHKACKSLGRLRVGVSSSVSHCCRRTWPMQCIH